jgi:translation initiation factor IF-2
MGTTPLGRTWADRPGGGGAGFRRVYTSKGLVLAADAGGGAASRGGDAGGATGAAGLRGLRAGEPHVPALGATRGRPALGGTSAVGGGVAGLGAGPPVPALGATRGHPALD